MGLYARQDQARRLTALLLAEGLGKLTRSASPTWTRSAARISTAKQSQLEEYTQKPRLRRDLHPRDSEVLGAIRGVDTNTHGCSCSTAYALVGSRDWPLWRKLTKIGTIPDARLGARSRKPYKDLMAFMLSSPLHVIISAGKRPSMRRMRETKEIQAVGVTMLPKERHL